MPTYFSVCAKFSSQLNVTPASPFIAWISGPVSAAAWNAASVLAISAEDRGLALAALQDLAQHALLGQPHHLAPRTSTVSPAPPIDEPAVVVADVDDAEVGVGAEPAVERHLALAHLAPASSVGVVEEAEVRPAS